MSNRPRPTLQWDLVAESFSEATFLWARWQDALESPRHTLTSVVHWVEERLHGALDGVRLAMQPGEPRAVDEILLPALLGKRDRPAAVAAHLLVGGARQGIEQVAAAMLGASPRRLAALAHAVACSTGAQWPKVLVEYVPRMPAQVQAAVLDAFAFRRWPLPPGIDGQVERNAKPVQLASLRLAACVRDRWTVPYIEWGLRRSDPELRIAACRAALLRGLEGAVAKAADAVRDDVPGSDALLPLLAQLRGERLLAVLPVRLQRPGADARAVFDALWCVGTVAAADLCVARLDDAAHGRLAADALRGITGIDPTPPPGREPPLDVPREELLLPQPDAAILRERWRERRPQLVEHQRYLEGQAFDPADVREALARAPLRRRHRVADELAARSSGVMQIESRAWSRVQWAQLAALAQRGDERDGGAARMSGAA